MNTEDYASDTDSDDSDFQPNKLEKSDDSDSIDEQHELDDDGDCSRRSQSKVRKGRHGKDRAKENNKNIVEIASERSVVANPDDEKQREEELWAAFLGDSVPLQSSSSSNVTTAINIKTSSKTLEIVSKPVPENIPNEQKSTATASSSINLDVQQKIFEFAGEEIVVVQDHHNILQNSSQNSSEKPMPSAGSKRSGSGLSSVLNQISKKNKLSVLQKTKLDWDGFKSTEGINEELQTHNRGKDGFLERRDFLERTDLRQFEIEKNMRQHSRRSHK